MVFKQLFYLSYLIGIRAQGTADVLDHHIMEAIAYRNLDRPSYLGSNF